MQCPLELLQSAQHIASKIASLADWGRGEGSAIENLAAGILRP